MHILVYQTISSGLSEQDILENRKEINRLSKSHALYTSQGLPCSLAHLEFDPFNFLLFHFSYSSVLDLFL